ncbi:protein swallow-like [Rhagoletis pomonella]|uniref:protein swallow-like n=1 Tax=Rhagoletis pomonella TaxID=28610 RepID=UPI001782F0F4|nr:protein swallow-like [Rhagoletis pomonella]
MSIQDESFPHDELFEMDLSPTPPHHRIQFPHRLRERQQQGHSGDSIKSPLTLVHNLSVSSSSADQTISSAESASEQRTQPAGLATLASDERMVKSDQTGLSTGGGVGDAHHLPEHDRKSYSYHDIHSQYTKRRFKHVESKVGQYIANIRSEDERRRKLAKFQRHSSMPEVLVHEPLPRKTAMQLHRGVTLTAARLNEALVGVIDAVDEEEQEVEEEVEAEPDASADWSASNVTAITTGTISTQSGSGAADEEDVYIDKSTYALLLDERDRLKSYNDYQQSKLDEKQSEITRLRQNVDFLRVRLSTAEDQLKKTQCGRYTLHGTSLSGSLGGYGQLGRQPSQSLLHCAAKSTKATQTDCERSRSPPPAPPPSPSPLNIGLPHDHGDGDDELHVFVTPNTPDANNNLCSGDGTMEVCGRNAKNVAAIQPMSLYFSSCTEESAERRTAKESVALRRRSNSLKVRQQQAEPSKASGSGSGTSQHNSRTSQPSSSDSAIEVEVIDLSSSPKPARRKRYSTDRDGRGTIAPKIRPLKYNHDPRTPSPMGLCIERCPNSTAVDISDTPEVQGPRKLAAKRSAGGRRKSISRRWFYLLGSCMRCSNRQQTESEQYALQQTYTQVPLLENTFERSGIQVRSN